jgi:hypothetical protein
MKLTHVFGGVYSKNELPILERNKFYIINLQGEEHVALVDAVMASFAKFDFTFKLSKTELYKAEMDFLGHRLTQDGLARQAAKVEAMPTTQTEVRSFISVIGYYRIR